MWSRLLVILFFMLSNCYAFDYGKVKIKLPEYNKRHFVSLGQLTEQSNDLVESRAIELRYLYQFIPSFQLGVRAANFSSAESSNGQKVKDQMQNNGIIQEVELKRKSLFLESQLNIAHGVMKFFGKYQAITSLQMGLGLGRSDYENSEKKNKITKNGWSYSLGLNSIISESYMISLSLTKVQDGYDTKVQNNQSYMGLRVGYLW